MVKWLEGWRGKRRLEVMRTTGSLGTPIPRQRWRKMADGEGQWLLTAAAPSASLSLSSPERPGEERWQLAQQ